MQLTRVEAAFIFGVVIPHISSIGISSAPPDCAAAVDTCMSDLCKSERAFYGGICNSEDEECQIEGSEVCNLTIQSALDQFPSLRGCVCAWEEERCDSIQALATQCHRKPASHQKRSAVMDWKSSSLMDSAYDGAGSCFDQMSVCVSDAVCNKHLASVLQACMADPCDRVLCQRATRRFYSSMPPNVADVLVMCECADSDQSCLLAKTTLHSGACGDEARICQDTVKQCVDDRNCRDLLKVFQAKCWRLEDAECGDGDLRSDECFPNLDPAHMFGADPECKTAFVATLGTVVHCPCSCEGLHTDDLKTCNMIHDVLHNRSLFMRVGKSSSGPSEPPEIKDSDHGHTRSHDYLLYVFATVLLVGVVVVMPLAVVSRIWMLRRRDKTKFHHPQKSSFAVTL
ncbi:GDNF family receptor alpha-like [Scophthalmus maximus]|uniref:GDNF family receptor alpha-like n=1 Tax=Scophthalmus maximus TaxID=52904 RepID=UPI001FA8C002|nr:GDNF family receptor alpha-like [Scophthalmus maximus]